MTEEQAVLYAGQNAYVALAAAEPLLEGLEEQGMLRLYREIEMPLVYTLDHMERAGIAVRADKLEEYGRKLQSGIEEVEQKIYAQAGETFNINSPKQLGVILFEKLKLPGGKKTKSGYSTAAGELERLARRRPSWRISWNTGSLQS